ncbi:hypothetical protein Tco_0864553, partial [Tanacetum coccineum]
VPLGRPCSDAVAKSLTPSWVKLCQRYVYLVTPSPASENIILRNVGVGKGSGSSVKENQHSIFIDPVRNIKYVNEGISSPSTINVNVESGLNTSNGDTSQKLVNFRTLLTPAGNGVNFVFLKEMVYVVNGRLSNIFSSKNRMESMLENGPCLIRNVPLILRKWTPDANIMIEDVYDLGNSKLVEKGDNVGVISYAHISLPVAFGIPNTTPIAEMINNLERQMLVGKLMLMDDDVKPINKVDYDPVNADSDRVLTWFTMRLLNSWLVEVKTMQFDKSGSTTYCFGCYTLGNRRRIYFKGSVSNTCLSSLVLSVSNTYLEECILDGDLVLWAVFGLQDVPVWLRVKGDRRGVKEKSGAIPSAKAVKDTVVVSSSTVEDPVDATMNTEDVNVGQTPTCPNVNPKPGASYANLFTTGPSRKATDFCTLFTPGGNEVDVVVLVESIRAISAWFANIVYEFFLGKRVAYLVAANYVRNTWGKYGLVKSMLNSSTGIFSFQFSSMDGLDAMLENGPWFIPFSEDGLSAIATKLGTPLMLDSYTSDMCIQSWGRSSYARAMIEVRVDEVCPKNLGLGVAKNLKKPSQAPKGVLVGSKLEFKPVKEYRLVSKKPTANTSGNKKKGVEPTKENVKTSSTSTTLIVDKIRKLEKLIIDGKVTLVDDDGKPLKKVDYPGDHESEDEVESVDNDMARSMTSESVGFVQRKKSDGNNGGTKNFKRVSVKPKTIYCPKVNQSTDKVSPITTPFAGSNSFKVLNFDNPGTEKVDSGNKASMSGVQEEGQSCTPLVEKINMFEHQLLEGKYVLVDDEGKHLEKFDYTGDHDSEDEVKSVDDKMASYSLQNQSGVGFGTNSLLEQWRETYGNADFDYDPYVDDMYETPGDS